MGYKVKFYETQSTTKIHHLCPKCTAWELKSSSICADFNPSGEAVKSGSGCGLNEP